jgi:hypothetical protein
MTPYAPARLMRPVMTALVWAGASVSSACRASAVSRFAGQAYAGRFRDEELHLWTLDDDGQVVRMRHYVDTAKHIAAGAGEDTTG